MEMFYSFISSVVPKKLVFIGFCSPSSRSKRELGYPFASRECAGGRAKG